MNYIQRKPYLKLAVLFTISLTLFTTSCKNETEDAKIDLTKNWTYTTKKKCTSR